MSDMRVAVISGTVAAFVSTIVCLSLVSYKTMVVSAAVTEGSKVAKVLKESTEDDCAMNPKLWRCKIPGLSK